MGRKKNLLTKDEVMDIGRNLIKMHKQRISELEVELRQSRRWAAVWKAKAKELWGGVKLRNETITAQSVRLGVVISELKSVRAQLTKFQALKCKTCGAYSESGWCPCCQNYKEPYEFCSDWEQRK